MSVDRRTSDNGKRKTPSQLVDLLLTVAAELGMTSDQQISALAGVSVETVSNWRSGAVREFKLQKLQAIKEGLTARLAALRERAKDAAPDPTLGLCPIEVDAGASPAELQRQFRDRVHYDYLGHRFLYFDPHGALAWESLVRTGYDQNRWLEGVAEAAEGWLDVRRDSRGRCRGPIAAAVGFDARERCRGLDVVSLGPGEGDKERRLLGKLLEAELALGRSLPWLTLGLIDVSIPLLLRAATTCRSLAAEKAAEHVRVLPVCGDFEEGRGAFQGRLPTERHPEGLRLILMLGNVFGNLRDEEGFVRERLAPLMRSGDLLWIEVGPRANRIEEEPLYRLTQPDRETTAGEACRRLLLEGPYRRWEAALGREKSELDMKVWVREDDDSARIPGSVNFCHDLLLREERRVCTMLYSRRYSPEGLEQWFADKGFDVVGTHSVDDSKREPRVLHLLLRRR